MSISARKQAPASPRTPSLGLYVHVPFCRTRCTFCAFYLQIHRDDAAARFVTALTREIDLYRDQTIGHGRSLHTVYFGGGTPTVLSTPQVIGILAYLRRSVSLGADVEVSIEAHPDTVSLEQLRALREAGFTRLSIGAESMDERELIQVGRPTMPEATVRAVRQGRDAGFTNLNIDLMYGLPNQTLASWQHTLDATLALGPDHLSCYALTVEENTALAADIRAGRAARPDSDLQTDMEWLAESRLAEGGFDRYELSNYAKPGFECRHNLLYWQNGQYLGLGPSAESYMDGVRFGNVPDLDRYCRALSKGELPVHYRAPLTLDEQRREALVFGLRQMAGVGLELVDALSQDPRWKTSLDELVRDDFLTCTGARLRLTRKGRQVADSVALQLF